MTETVSHIPEEVELGERAALEPGVEIKSLLPGIIQNDLAIATYMVAKEIGNERGIKKFGKTIATSLHEQPFPQVWQTMTEAEIITLSEEGVDIFAVVSRVFDKAHGIHTGEIETPSNLASKGLRKVMRSKSETEKSPVSDAEEIILPEILQPLSGSPQVVEKLGAVQQAELQYRNHLNELAALRWSYFMLVKKC